MKNEIWRRVVGFSRYEISNLGRLRSWWPIRKHVPHICNGHYDPDGYRKAVLTRSDGRKRTLKLATLVALAFIGPRPLGREVAHKNGKLTDDRAKNLKYKTHRANILDKITHGTIIRGEAHTRHKLTRIQVTLIRASPETGSALAKQMGVAPCTISSIRNRQTWAWL